MAKGTLRRIINEAATKSRKEAEQTPYHFYCKNCHNEAPLWVWQISHLCHDCLMQAAYGSKPPTA